MNAILLAQAFSILLFFLPEKIYDSLVTLFTHVFRNTLEFSKTKIGFSGNVLLEAMNEVEGDFLIGIKNKPLYLPQYKFYTEIAHEIVDYSKKYGAPLKMAFAYLKQGLLKDNQMERKSKSDFFGGLFQFVFTTLITWVFVIFSQRFTEVDLSSLQYFTIAFLQIIGACVYIILYVRLKERLLGSFTEYISTIIKMRTLLDLGMPLKHTLSLSTYFELNEGKSRTLRGIKARLDKAVSNLSQRGLPIFEELERLNDELWFLYGEHFQGFIKRMAAVKFGVLALFFLSSYFIYLFFLFSRFLIE